MMKSWFARPNNIYIYRILYPSYQSDTYCTSSRPTQQSDGKESCDIFAMYCCVMDVVFAAVPGVEVFDFVLVLRLVVFVLVVPVVFVVVCGVVVLL